MIHVTCRNCGEELPDTKISSQSIKFKRCSCGYIERAGLRNMSRFLEAIENHLDANNMDLIFEIKGPYNDISVKVKEK